MFERTLVAGKEQICTSVYLNVNSPFFFKLMMQFFLIYRFTYSINVENQIYPDPSRLRRDKFRESDFQRLNFLIVQD